MLPDEIVSFWGKDLIRWPKAAADSLGIPETSRRFLAEVGLPCPKDPLFIYAFDCGQPLVRTAENPSYVRIAHKPRLVVLDESKGGLVFMPATRRDPDRFVNSSVEQFLAFVVLEEKMNRELARVQDEITSSRAILTSIEQMMREVDRAALESEENYWSVVIEGVWYQFLSDDELEQLVKKYRAR